MENAQDLIGIPADRLMAIAVFGVLALLVLFILLGLARWWSLRAQKRGHEKQAGLNLAELKRQRDAGEITPEEYKAIYTRLSGIASGGNTARQPIKGTGDARPFGFAPFDRLTVRASRGQGRQGGKGSTDGEK
jgi:hypothetical protein